VLTGLLPLNTQLLLLVACMCLQVARPVFTVNRQLQGSCYRAAADTLCLL
jgi:hypothetical protein